MYEFEALRPTGTRIDRGTKPLSFDAPIREQLEEIRPRTILAHLGGAVALGTDVGLNRDENEDRVIAALTLHPALGRPTFVAAVADGMGGMLDGGTCAVMTLTAFLEEFVSPAPGSLALRLTRSAAKANEVVFDRYQEKGGSTLSAVAIDSTGLMVGVNIGDSRIYASTPSGFVPLTTDDTLSAAFGSQGNGLIQYIGIGEGLRSHVIEVPPSTHTLFVSSDGAHFPEAETFGQVMARSPDPKSAVERALALARWLGSPDNASIIAIDVAELKSRLAPSSSLQFATFGLTGSLQVVAKSVPVAASTPTSMKSTTASDRPPEKKRAKPRKKKQEKPQGQLQIEITPTTTDTREDSE